MSLAPFPVCTSLVRGSRWRAALGIAALSLGFAGSACADAYLGTIGGRGGGQFQAPCPNDELLAGFALRTGDDVDAIRPLCVTAYGPRKIGTIPYTVGDGLVEKYRNPTREVYGNHQPIAGDWWELESGWHGGTGGEVRHLVCPKEQPIVTGMFVGAEGVDTVIVNNIHLFCGVAADTQAVSEHPAAIFDAPAYKASEAVFGIGSGGSQPYRDGNTQRCPDGQVAVGVHGRSGVWLDAIGLICDAPQLGAAGRALGRVETSSASRPAGWTICDSARAARARNSPAAAGLEKQCLALKPVEAMIRKPATRMGRSAAMATASVGQSGAAAAAAPPAAAGPVDFSPPLLADNAQLWACPDAAAAARADAGACSGVESAQAYCRMRGAQSGPDVAVADAQPEVPVRAVDGSLCPDAEACRVVSRMQCDR